METFKPNLIPNNPKKPGQWSREIRNELINKNGGIRNYLITKKKDGVRLQLGMAPTVLSRSLEIPRSKALVERMQPLNDRCLELNITLDGEFYMEDTKFNEIFRFYANEDVTRPKYRAELEKKKAKDEKKFNQDFNNRSIEWLTTFHKDLKFWLFDGILHDKPELKTYDERMNALEDIVWWKFALDARDQLVVPVFEKINCTQELDEKFDEVVEKGWEGLVLTCRDHIYETRRTNLKKGTLLKMKDENRQYDGVIVGVVEGETHTTDAPKEMDNFGTLSYSGKKEYKMPNGKAKGFLVEYEDRGTFTVGLRGFDDADKIELLRNSENYIGRHFIYTGMPPVKDFPRSVYFKCWRDAK